MKGVVAVFIYFSLVSSTFNERDADCQGRWKKSLREFLRENFQSLGLLYCFKLFMGL